MPKASTFASPSTSDARERATPSTARGSESTGGRRRPLITDGDPINAVLGLDVEDVVLAGRQHSANRGGDHASTVRIAKDDHPATHDGCGQQIALVDPTDRRRQTPHPVGSPNLRGNDRQHPRRKLIPVRRQTPHENPWHTAVDRATTYGRTLGMRLGKNVRKGMHDHDSRPATATSRIDLDHRPDRTQRDSGSGLGLRPRGTTGAAFVDESHDVFSDPALEPTR